MPPIILASASPRRHELLALGGIEFQVQPASAPEIPEPDEQPDMFVRRVSQSKARLAAEAAEPGAVVLGADTIVVLNGQILGKPRDAADAVSMLRILRGHSHQVLTGLAVIDTASGRLFADLVSASVPMRDYSDEEIDAYVSTGNPLDKAGAYAIQFSGFQPVDLARFDDCFANVMGLPVCRTLHLLRQARPELALAGQQLGDCQNFDAGACPVVTRINKESAR